VITQAKLARYKLLKFQEYELKALQKELQEAIKGNAYLEPGELDVELRIEPKKRLTAATIIDQLDLTREAAVIARRGASRRLSLRPGQASLRKGWQRWASP
jgi:hypothetical protein